MAYGVNAPFGLRPLSSINGGSWTEKTNKYYIAASADGATTYNVNIFSGDPVIWNRVAALAGGNGGGTIARYVFNNDQANADNTRSVLGVFAGCQYTTNTGLFVESRYWPAATAVKAGSKITAFILDDPTTIFDVQVSTRTNVLNDARFTYANLGGNFGVSIAAGGGNLIPQNPADGNPATGQSAVYLAKVFGANNDNTVVTLPLKAIDYTQNPINLANPISYVADATTAPFLNVMVTINNHVYRAGTVGTVAA